MHANTSHRPRLAILTNIIAPYRVVLYEGLGRSFETTVLFSGEEQNRGTWSTKSHDSDAFTAHRSWGMVLKWFRRERGLKFDYRFLHITPGYLIDLIRLEPDAIISTEMGLRSLIALLYGTLYKRPVWIHWGGTLHTERNRVLAKRVIRWLFTRLVRRWISYGRSSTQYLTSIGVPRSTILEIQNCVDDRRMQTPARPLFDLTPRPVLLYAGQMIPRKGVEQLLRVAAQAQRRNKEFSLVLVGDGIKRDDYAKAAAELGLKHTIFLPGKPPNEMPSVYRSADWLIMPSLEDVWGLVINEALLAGVPVLASRFAGASEELLSPEHLFDPLEEADFLRALEWAIAHTPHRAESDKLISSDQVVGRIRVAIEAALQIQ